MSSRESRARGVGMATLELDLEAMRSEEDAKTATPSKSGGGATQRLRRATPIDFTSLDHDSVSSAEHVTKAAPRPQPSVALHILW